jgi:hypothetical protein
MLTEAFTDALDRAYAQARTVLDPSAHERLEKALKLVVTEQVRAIPFQDGHWFVQGSEAEPYLVVRAPRWQCECPDHHFRQVFCAHIMACQLLVRATQTAQPEPVETPAPAQESVQSAQEAGHPALPEAPVSITLKAMLHGHEVLVTLRGTDFARVREQVEAASQWLRSQTPAQPDVPQCPTHGALKKSTKGKGWYCPNKATDGQWCQGR